jgi:hypothetical protein
MAKVLHEAHVPLNLASSKRNFLATEQGNNGQPK